MITGKKNVSIILMACLPLLFGMKKKKNFLWQETGLVRNHFFIF